MLKKGDKKAVKYWGVRTVKDIVMLDKPIKCYNQYQGEILFNPTIIKIKWGVDQNEFYD